MKLSQNFLTETILIFLCLPHRSQMQSLNDDFKVSKGQYTFDSEGHEGGKYHTRKAHHPSEESGVTIGRGYDLRYKTQAEVIADFTKAGIDPQTTQAYVNCIGLFGKQADEKVNSGELKEITPKQQKILFEITYQKLENDVKRISCENSDVVKKYGKPDWDSLDYRVKEFATDLRYRGDYHKDTRAFLQEHIVNNDIKNLYLAYDQHKQDIKCPNNRHEYRRKIAEQPPK